jgi:GxxExxY protein
MRWGESVEHAPLDSGTEALVTATIDCAMTVHKTLGPGFLERAYERALLLELQSRGVPFEAQREIWVTYRDTLLMAQRVDVIVGGCVLVELKAFASRASLRRSARFLVTDPV